MSVCEHFAIFSWRLIELEHTLRTWSGLHNAALQVDTVVRNVAFDSRSATDVTFDMLFLSRNGLHDTYSGLLCSEEIDWTDGVYGVLPTAKPLEVLKAIDKMLVMGAAMDPEALKAGVLAHSKAIKSIDGKGVTTLADYTATNAAIGHMIASVPASKTMDVYNAFNKFSLGKDVGPYMMSKVSAEDAKAAYKAFLEFKDVVKASQR